jgi:hypothetical protein
MSYGTKMQSGVEKAAWILDDELAQNQRDALMEILTGKAGGLFSMLTVKNPLVFGGRISIIQMMQSLGP